MSQEMKNYLGAMLIAFGLFLFWMYGIGGWQKAQAYRTTLAERTQLLESRQAALGAVSRLYEQYRQQLAGQNGTKLAAAVPVKKEIPELISAVTTIAQQSGMIVQELQVDEQKQEQDTSQLKTLGIALRMSGGYLSFRQFLASLEQNVRLLNVDSISVTGGDQGADRLTIEVRAFAYFLK